MRRWRWRRSARRSASSPPSSRCAAPAACETRRTSDQRLWIRNARHGKKEGSMPRRIKPERHITLALVALPPLGLAVVLAGWAPAAEGTEDSQKIGLQTNRLHAQ